MTAREKIAASIKAVHAELDENAVGDRSPELRDELEAKLKVLAKAELDDYRGAEVAASKERDRQYLADTEAREDREQDRLQAEHVAELEAKEAKEARAQQGPKPKAAGKLVSRNGKRTFYRGAKRDRSLDPRWDKVPTAVRESVLEGNLKDADMTFAWVLYDHVRRHKGEGRRITAEQLAAKVKRSTSSAERSLRRLRAAKVIAVEGSGHGNQRGAIYRFQARSAVAA